MSRQRRLFTAGGANREHPSNDDHANQTNPTRSGPPVLTIGEPFREQQVDPTPSDRFALPGDRWAAGAPAQD